MRTNSFDRKRSGNFQRMKLVMALASVAFMNIRPYCPRKVRKCLYRLSLKKRGDVWTTRLNSILSSVTRHCRRSLLAEGYLFVLSESLIARLGFLRAGTRPTISWPQSVIPAPSQSTDAMPSRSSTGDAPHHARRRRLEATAATKAGRCAGPGPARAGRPVDSASVSTSPGGWRQRPTALDGG